VLEATVTPMSLRRARPLPRLVAALALLPLAAPLALTACGDGGLTDFLVAQLATLRPAG
jgi:hypothetical protein